MSTAGIWGKFLTDTKVGDLPPLALERARMVIASTIASAAMGADIVSSNISELHGGKTFARTKRKYGKKKAQKQAIAIALSKKRESKKTSRKRSQ